MAEETVVEKGSPSSSQTLPFRSQNRNSTTKASIQIPSPLIASAKVASAPSTELTHRINASGSVQALVADDEILIAGLQGGGIVAWSLDTFELVADINAHEESVLGLQFSDDHELLFSCGVDSVVNVWSMSNFERLYSLHSHFEVGDIFCLAYSANLKAIFCGSQNSGVQWYFLGEGYAVPSSASTRYHANRKHKFFDSLGPGGAAAVSLEQAPNGVISDTSGGQDRCFPKSNYVPFAHKSYIYCMIIVKGVFNTALEEGEVLITGGGGGTIKIWGIDDLSGRGLVLFDKFKNPGYSVLSMAYSGLFLYAGLSDGVAHVYNLASRQLVQKLQVGKGDVSSIQILDGMAFCGTSTGWVKQFDPRFTETGSWSANNGKILASAVTKSPQRDVYITAGNDNTVAFWNVTTTTKSDQEMTPHDNDELVNSLKEFVSYRTIAATPAYVGDCYEAVSFLRKLFNLFDSTTTLLPTDGANPILLAKFDASQNPKSKKTILFYGHYDIVDAEYNESGDVEQWLADPFQLHPLNGYLYGRGVSDNKGPILAALYAVAGLRQSKSLSCNVVFLLEGEEEAGSRGFQKTVRSNREKIGEVDFVLLSNSYWLDDHLPCLTYGMRGVIHAVVTVTSNKPDRHSGMDGKSEQHEPLKDLTVLLSSLTGPSGTKIMIPGFYAAMEQREKSEMKQYEGITASLVPGHPEIKDQRAFTESLMQRWREPNLTVHRIEVPESKTAVTISRSARATLSIRIVPNQDAEQVANGLTAFFQSEFARIKSTNRLEVNVSSKADAWLGRPSNEIFQALESAITEVWNPEPETASHRVFPRPTASSPQSGGHPKRYPHRRTSSLVSKGNFTMANIPRKPLYIREGGSIPAIAFLEKEFEAPAAMFPMGQASDNAHLCNERIRVENLYKGREVFKRVFSEL